MQKPNKRRWLIAVLAILAVVAVVLYGKWRDASNRGGQLAADPFRIAGNLYYVGANDVTSFLITGPEGHVLIDGGYPGTAPMIMASIARLGFKISDVKILLNSHSHLDHAGGLAELQKASGAQLWVSEGDADIVARGGAGDPTLGPLRFVTYLPMFRYPAPRVDHRFKDGATINLGSIELTAHVTPGHTPGCTTWTFPIREGDRELHVVHAGCLNLPVSFGKHPEIRSEFEQDFRSMRSLPVDIWISSHAKAFDRYRKFREQAKAKDPADPFIDPTGYRAYIDSGEARFRRHFAEKQ
jgi:metallo-beta-lactamase class B